MSALPLIDTESDFIHDYVRLDGQRVHVVTAGAGRPVLLIPGWPQTWYAWRHVMRALAAHGFLAIAVGRRHRIFQPAGQRLRHRRRRRDIAPGDEPAGP